MMLLRVLFNWLVPALRPLEKKLISALIEQFPIEVRKVLAGQVKQINYVQRHIDEREINLYSIRRGKAFFDERFLFPVRQPEMKLASMIFEVPIISKSFHADFWLANGRLFSIEFDQSPREVRTNDIEIKEITILNNPTIPIGTIEETSLGINTPQSWLTEWSGKWGLRRIKQPLPYAKRKEIMYKLATRLPSDYIELVEQTEGLEIDSCLVFGISEIHSLILPEGDYYVLAEFTGRGTLAVKQGSSDAEIYLLSYEDERPIAVGSSVKKAIEQQFGEWSNGVGAKTTGYPGIE